MDKSKLEQLKVTNYTPPTAEEVREFLKKHDLTGSEAGALVDVSSRQVRKYTGDDAKVPYAVWYTWHSKLGVELK